MARVLVLHGPNLNLLGEREPGIYGRVTLEKINEDLAHQGEAAGVEVDCFQSNHEGELIDRIHSARGKYDLIIINPGALTHYSYALHDAITSVPIPTIEVHLSNIYTREEWRHHSVTAPAAVGQIAGFGPLSYTLAMTAAIRFLDRSNGTGKRQ